MKMQEVMRIRKSGGDLKSLDQRMFDAGVGRVHKFYQDSYTFSGTSK